MLRLYPTSVHGRWSYLRPSWTTVFFTILVLALILAHIAYPAAAIDTTTLGLLALMLAVWFLPFVKTIVLPGGARLEMDLQRAKEVVDSITPAASYAAPERGAAPMSGNWRSFIAVDPNVALAGLRIELERVIATLALRHVPDKSAAFRGLSTMTRALQENGVLSQTETEALLLVIETCNRAVHARYVPPPVATEIARLGDALLSLLSSKLK